MDIAACKLDSSPTVDDLGQHREQDWTLSSMRLKRSPTILSCSQPLRVAPCWRATVQSQSAHNRGTLVHSKISDWSTIVGAAHIVRADPARTSGHFEPYKLAALAHQVALLLS